MYKCNHDGTITVKEHCMTSSCNHCATDLKVEANTCYMVGDTLTPASISLEDAIRSAVLNNLG